MSKSYKHIIEEVVTYQNISSSFDYVIRGKKKNTWEGRWILRHRDLVIRAIISSISGGTLRTGKYRTRTINERGKIRVIQSINLLRSIAIHAIMNIVERHINKSFIADSAASIKGRGGHYLLRRLLYDMRKNPKGTRYTYKDDICKFYQSIIQDLMMQIIHSKFRDRRLVRILERWVRMLSEGMSIGMRPSQCLANLLLSVFCDHVVKDRDGAKYYRRYCDDRLLQDDSLYFLTAHIRTLKKQTEKAGLKIKTTSQVWDIRKRPIDFLGYVIYGNGKIAIRKATKKRFANRWKHVKSLRRKRELIASFYGICKHAHSRHLFKKLTGLSMTQFADIGFIYQRDGKKDFSATKISLREIVNENVTVLDFETDIKTREGDDRFVVLLKSSKYGERKFFTNNDKMKQALLYAREKNMIPFDTVIKTDGGYGYMFT